MPEKENFTEEDFLELIEYQPNWFIKWGITIIAFIVLALIYLSSHLNEPEIIEVNYCLFKNNVSIQQRDSLIKKTSSLTSKIWIDITDKNKISPGKKFDIEFYFSSRIYITACVIDSIHFDPGTDKYILSQSILSRANDILEDELRDRDTLKGKARIIISRKSFLDKIFNRYAVNNK